MAAKNVAYQDLLTYSLSLAIRAQTLRSVMATRSGLAEDLSVAFRLHRPIDPFQLHDWLAHDFTPMTEAWSKVQTTDSSDAVEAATSVVRACTDLLSAATAIGRGRNRVVTALVGLAWTAEQESALRQATEQLARERERFGHVVREDLGSEAVTPPA